MAGRTRQRTLSEGSPWSFRRRRSCCCWRPPGQALQLSWRRTGSQLLPQHSTAHAGGSHTAGAARRRGGPHEVEGGGVLQQAGDQGQGAGQLARALGRGLPPTRHRQASRQPPSLGREVGPPRRRRRARARARTHRNSHQPGPPPRPAAPRPHRFTTATSRTPPLPPPEVDPTAGPAPSTAAGADPTFPINGKQRNPSNG